MTKSIEGTFVFDGGEPQSLSTEVTGTISQSLVAFRVQVMEHLTTYMRDQGAGGKTTVEANEDAFADNEDVEEDNVDVFLKGKKGSKRQKV